MTHHFFFSVITQVVCLSANASSIALCTPHCKNHIIYIYVHYNVCGVSVLPMAAMLAEPILSGIYDILKDIKDGWAWFAIHGSLSMWRVEGHRHTDRMKYPPPPPPPSTNTV